MDGPVPKRLSREFFNRSAIELAPALLGVVLSRRIDGFWRRARIIETEAYLGPKDLASHSSKGRTPRTEVMFGPPGYAYVYFIYGMHQMLNVVAGPQGAAHAVLIRGAEPLDGWAVDLTGPGKVARAFAIVRADNGTDLTSGDILLSSGDPYAPRVIRRKRVGVDYSGRWKDRLLRFIDSNSPIASRLPKVRVTGGARWRG